MPALGAELRSIGLVVSIVVALLLVFYLLLR